MFVRDPSRSGLECMHRYRTVKPAADSPDCSNCTYRSVGPKDRVGVQLNEHLSKGVLSCFGVRCTDGVLVADVEAAVDQANQIGYPVALKAQLPASGRGKAGGVQRADDEVMLRQVWKSVLSIRLDGMVPSSVRLESWMPPEAEIYLALTLSALHRGPVLLFNGAGGVDVEDAAPPDVVPVRSDGSIDITALHRALMAAGLPASGRRSVLELSQSLARAYAATDARLIELNPVGIYSDGARALDARIIIDNNSLYRQPWVAGLARASEPRPPEDIERELSRLEYVPLQGRIGLISGGAGMTLAAMDLLSAAGAGSACFLDCSANPTRNGYKRALDLVSESPQVDAILISIFGGLTLVDKVAKNICDVLQEGRYTKPITFRLMGTNYGRATEILTAYGYKNHETLEDAVAAAVSTLPIGGRQERHGNEVGR